MLTDLERQRLAGVLHESVRQMRGRFLNTVAVIDIELAWVISQYFCSDDARSAIFMSEIATKEFFFISPKDYCS